MAKKTKTFRISEEGQQILTDLSAQFGCDETDLLELGLRLLWGSRDFIAQVRSYAIKTAGKYRKKGVLR